MKRVGFYTLGCKVNQYDTESMINLFTEAGYKVVDFQEEADVYIINTCTVTHQGARKSRQITRRAKRRNPESIVAVVGCYPQVSPDEVLEVSGVDLIVGTEGRKEIVELIEQARLAKEPLNFVQNVMETEEFEEIPITESKERTRASLKIEDGCDRFCAYCIIPYTRGTVRSRDLSEAVAEAERLAQNGFEEIVLTGIHLGAYGEEKGEATDLISLIKELIRIPDLERIRLSSIEATEVSQELIDLIADEKKLCRHLHLPLQSGSNKVLKAMNRDYTTEEFAAKITQIREQIPEIAVTTDVMVGFPGETEEDFNTTYGFIKELGFSDLHVFKYSKREGTPAAKFDEQVHSRVKKKRSAKLRELGERMAEEYRDKFIGKGLDVMIEEERDHRTGLLTGLTDNYLKVMVDAGDSYQGELVSVKLVDTEDNYLIGSIEE
ncbi:MULTISPECIES: tRNA (N(6)-L-threonylcarbamoyladenosine(37)-C(2))-methylthiotransferase MtaB [unclassified Candidatus Frackibacter]|uniref:tRNA (N(6)-L-threonylcarbamoyladenosine(37)-C(2))- methylthiotransferase MtaB n=1 Tax=unclassified Candidatus Frackibacter TaxID=2648818 RepID=UPI000880B385|nr:MULTISPECIES: tRNA (N(6)-L-threonylcarbamoyladenosine(37)-C(2))-methylthiotransferase MtaB [unclassified Candidatus Frackibacter]SDC73849.1 threonylcarbamoyladenosine tRNA methylthiotransferase MtaB [Candidatus Frackibacter sp. WG11]SEM87931.1 threonylcarbamoyladenosine tRNA methylthiotransferase MtaB [Candidatus Frackibacter sp. WG12]SFL97238.1 threonylcarbamoyladenosine tRNA methylthiotransferase MtaB [Candidatus Frackibacter sp. WG13]